MRQANLRLIARLRQRLALTVSSNCSQFSQPAGVAKCLLLTVVRHFVYMLHVDRWYSKLIPAFLVSKVIVEVIASSFKPPRLVA